jgi:hypothetical protein
MFFQSVHEPRGLSIDARSFPQTFTVQGSGDYQVAVTFALDLVRADVNDDVSPPALLCHARAEFEPGRKLSHDFRELAACRLPAGSDPTVSRHSFPRLTQDGRLTDPSDAPYTAMPERMRQFIVAVRSELANAANRTVGLLRWRMADEGPYDAIRTRGAMWSLDCQEWHHLPTALETRTSVSLVPCISADIRSDVQAMLDSGAEEPLAHKLWREAWQLRGDSPRSALLIGMTALEVGVKNYIARAIPDTDWLLGQLPAPPTHRLLAEYIPTLTPPGSAKPPSITSDEARAMRDAQGLRNRLAHTGNVEVRADRLGDELQLVQDILWRLDTASGFDWAATASLIRVQGGLTATPDEA